MTIMLDTNVDEMMLIIGTKEVQIFDLSRKNDLLANELKASKLDTIIAQQKQSEAMKDNDMAQIELQNLRSELARLTMRIEKSDG
jgi:hypothetical protein